jgi:hypothetical protein
MLCENESRKPSSHGFLVYLRRPESMSGIVQFC